jgi:hypothetical protein
LTVSRRSRSCLTSAIDSVAEVGLAVFEGGEVASVLGRGGTAGAVSGFGVAGVIAGAAGLVASGTEGFGTGATGGIGGLAAGVAAVAAGVAATGVGVAAFAGGDLAGGFDGGRTIA